MEAEASLGITDCWLHSPDTGMSRFRYRCQRVEPRMKGPPPRNATITGAIIPVGMSHISPASRATCIAVIGGGNAASPEDDALAEEVGREIARNKAILVCGGMGGVMEAACRGAVRAGGLTVGILGDDHDRRANPYVRMVIVTGMGHARNVVVVRSSQAVIAIGGSYGTLSEIAFALIYGIPVVGIDTWRLSRGDTEDDGIILAEDARGAVETAVSLARAKMGENNV